MAYYFLLRLPILVNQVAWHLFEHTFLFLSGNRDGYRIVLFIKSELCLSRNYNAMKHLKFSCLVFGCLIVLSLIIPRLVVCPPLSKNDEAALDIESLRAAISLYYIHNDRLPENLGNLMQGSILYIAQTLKDPWITDYQYSILSEDAFLLWSKSSILNGNTLVLFAFRYDGHSFRQVAIEQSSFGP
ncbi:hypothetical protein CWB99_16675 [Pseudoalteromonas rubra]|uniref:Type II secretion system protein GspG C-terminal domain-containing protein n=2 Tax=Pseudoalteromonas rubra TaxID=43658 RepID=A0A5S3WI70_9GAMM|nr:hypothetical protein CWB99_16675 [Pseudoalteromonas rubra]TMP27654.1 hypothetical protein CWC00_22870 [Pseudoalteromonas rubra]